MIAASARRATWPMRSAPVHRAGTSLRRSTSDWFGRNAERLSVGRSVDAVLGAYADRH